MPGAPTRSSFSYEAARSFAFEYDNKRDLLGPKTRDMLDEASKVGVDAYDDARRIAKRARLALADLMGGYDVILTPSAPGAAPHGIGATGVATFNLAVDVDGHAMRERAGARGPLRPAAGGADRRAVRPRPRGARSRAVRRAGAGAAELIQPPVTAPADSGQLSAHRSNTISLSFSMAWIRKACSA